MLRANEEMRPRCILQYFFQLTRTHSDLVCKRIMKTCFSHKIREYSQIPLLKSKVMIADLFADRTGHTGNSIQMFLI